MSSVSEQWIKKAALVDLERYDCGKQQVVGGRYECNVSFSSLSFLFLYFSLDIERKHANDVCTQSDLLLVKYKLSMKTGQAGSGQ